MQDQAQMIDTEPVRDPRGAGHVWSLGRDLKDQNYSGRVPPDLPAGRERARSSGNRRTCPTTPGSTWSARRSWPTGTFRRGQDVELDEQRAGQPAASVRPGDPAARRQAALEDRGRHLPPGPAVLLLLRAAGHHAPAAAGLPRGLDLRRHAHRRPRPARRRVRRARLGLRLPDRPRPVGRAASSSSTGCRRSPDDGLQRPAPGRRRRPDQGGQVGPPLRDRPRPDEGRSGTARSPSRRACSGSTTGRSTSAAPSSAPST